MLALQRPGACMEAREIRENRFEFGEDFEFREARSRSAVGEASAQVESSVARRERLQALFHRATLRSPRGDDSSVDRSDGAREAPPKRVELPATMEYFFQCRTPSSRRASLMVFDRLSSFSVPW